MHKSETPEVYQSETCEVYQRRHVKCTSETCEVYQSETCEVYPVRHVKCTRVETCEVQPRRQKDILSLARQTGFDELESEDIEEVLASHTEELTKEDLQQLTKHCPIEDKDDEEPQRT
ncbi:putative Tigger transposable element-derived protein 1-like 227 [Homarus americanus]|uniref:Putative Tigger transposable element-derived protein 1-like 227 n=1 Tax=Homarus americanus TaxID=6706 RepID=A0A8J5JUR8_HOMAM|nr:putative Tigger transposable element-derived protein 1-like 227 [Homarus americanus]